MKKLKEIQALVLSWYIQLTAVLGSVLGWLVGNVIGGLFGTFIAFFISDFKKGYVKSAKDIGEVFEFLYYKKKSKERKRDKE